MSGRLVRSFFFRNFDFNFPAHGFFEKKEKQKKFLVAEPRKTSTTEIIWVLFNSFSTILEYEKSSLQSCIVRTWERKKKQSRRKRRRSSFSVPFSRVNRIKVHCEDSKSSKRNMFPALSHKRKKAIMKTRSEGVAEIDRRKIYERCAIGRPSRRHFMTEIMMIGFAREID